MVEQLFKPFRAEQWVRLAITGLLAGELGGTGGCSVPMRPRGGGSSRLLEQAVVFRSMPMVVGIVLLVLLGITLGIVFLYISSRMRFVLFDSVVNRECHIRVYWGRHGGPALRYFFFHLLFTVVVVVAFGLLVGAAAAMGFGFGWLRNPAQHVMPLVLAGLVFVILFLGIVIGAVLVIVLTKDFVVPQMALEDVSVSEGWRRLWTMMKAEKGGYAGYVGLKIVLSIASAAVMAIAAIVAVLLMMIPIGIIGAIGFFGGRAIGFGWNPYTIAIAIVAGCIAVVGIIFGVLLLSVPTIVFFPAYAIHFLAGRYPALNARLFPSPTAT